MRVSGLGHFPLGTPVPPKEHAVCVSIPTFKDLVGYEEKKPEILNKLKSGYPRFVRHQRINELSKYWNRQKPEAPNETFFFSNPKDWDFAQNILKISEAEVEQQEKYLIVHIPGRSKDCAKLHKFFQHAGVGLSSRHAETILDSLGILSIGESVTPNLAAEDDIKSIISKAHGPQVSPEDVLLTISGANAFTSVFRAALIQAKQQQKKLWVRLGWLYLDTIEIMDLLVENQAQIIDLNHPDEFYKLEEIFNTYGQDIAGIVTEFPSNPLLHSCDLVKVRQLCDQHNALLIVDPTMASPKNAKVTTLSDVVINSLTKYANWEGDVMMGSVVFPTHSDKGMALKMTVSEMITCPFHKDMERMAEQIPYYDNFIDRTNQSQLEIVEYLNSHPKIKRVYWAYQQSTGKNYRNIAGDDKPGCVVSFEVKGSFTNFYNALGMLKSPSFGTEFSLCCPYVYLAHYKMVTSESGLKILNHAGLSTELLRLSVGLEEPEEIKESLDQALKLC